MRDFYTKATVEASRPCRVCGKNTPWRIMGGRPAYCIPCFEKPRPAPAAKVKPEPEPTLF